MIDDMMSVMQRINDLKKRFGLMTKPNKNQTVNQNNNFNNQLKSSIKQNISMQNKNSKISNSKLSRTQINQLVNDISRKEGVSASLVKAVIETESSYNQNAISPKGAMGLMQLMPATADRLGIKNPFVPEENITGGVKLLKILLKQYNGDYKKTLAAYNAGENVVDKFNGIPPYKETKGYVKKVINSYMKNN